MARRPVLVEPASEQARLVWAPLPKRPKRFAKNMSGCVWFHASDLWQHGPLYAASQRGAAAIQAGLELLMLARKAERGPNSQGEINNTSLFFTWVQMFSSVGGN